MVWAPTRSKGLAPERGGIRRGDFNSKIPPCRPSGQDARMPPATGRCNYSGRVPVAQAPRRAMALNLAAFTPLRFVRCGLRQQAPLVCPPAGGRFNGWLVYDAVSVIKCFNYQYDFKSLCIRILPFAAAVRPCTILATPCFLHGGSNKQYRCHCEER